MFFRIFECKGSTKYKLNRVKNIQVYRQSSFSKLAPDLFLNFSLVRAKQHPTVPIRFVAGQQNSTGAVSTTHLLHYLFNCFLCSFLGWQNYYSRIWVLSEKLWNHPLQLTQENFRRIKTEKTFGFTIEKCINSV